MLTAVEAAKEIAAKRGAAAEYGAGGATSKLGDAVRQENDEFIASQSDQQALLMRYGSDGACGIEHHQAHTQHHARAQPQAAGR